jgi:prepilin-type N-terminal cleavage/methylation domain-containing protein
MRRRSAFTLVELLVVIGIIAVLISILIPALTRARTSAISVQCMSNMKQVGQAALMYSMNFKGWYPPSQAAQIAGGNNTDEKFLDYNDGTANRYNVGRLMAKYAGYKVPDYDATQSWTTNVTNGYVSPDTPCFFCPADDQPARAGEPPWPDNNLLYYGHTLSGNDNGKLRYWWTANPWFWPADQAAVNTTYGGDVDLAAARVFAHMDIEPDRNPRYFGTNPDPAAPWFNTAKPCKPGLDYLRKVTDKHAAEIPIMVDRSKQHDKSVTNAGGWYMPHGGAGPESKKGWKNELFGDGHCESRRLDQMKEHYASGNPQAW